jgi:hypothetical protein
MNDGWLEIVSVVVPCIGEGDQGGPPNRTTRHDDRRSSTSMSKGYKLPGQRKCSSLPFFQSAFGSLVHHPNHEGVNRG